LSPARHNPLTASPGPQRSGQSILCYVTDRSSLASVAANRSTALLQKLRSAIDAGVDWIQIREKDLPSDELLVLAQQAVSAARDLKTRIIVNHSLDLALTAQAAGVHLGRASLPIREVIRRCREQRAPQGFLVGVSCHALEEVREAADAGASYVIFGPVFDTPSKRAYGPPAGAAQLAAVCASVNIPVLAIGGVELQNVGECLQAGAAGIAAIRMFQDARTSEELKTTIRSLRELKS
jgi:thiamine-phosphate pyrophosphorylase